MNTSYVLETLTQQREAAVQRQVRTSAARRPVVNSTPDPVRTPRTTSWRRSLRLVLLHG